MQWLEIDFNCLLSLTTINHSMFLLTPHKIPGCRYFFVVPTPPYARSMEYERTPGYEAVFFLPDESLAGNEWRMMMYEIGGDHSPVAGIKHAMQD